MERGHAVAHLAAKDNLLHIVPWKRPTMGPSYSLMTNVRIGHVEADYVTSLCDYLIGPPDPHCIWLCTQHQNQWRAFPGTKARTTFFFAVRMR